MSSTRRYAFGPFVFDAATHVLWRGPQVEPLTPKAAALLDVLLERQGDVVPKAELLGRVWHDTVVEEANLSVTVSALRKVLGPQDDGEQWVETVPRRGYRLCGPVAASGGAGARRLALAVLPFRSVGSADDHLGLGLADALINRLLPLPGLLVRPTGAVLRYVGRELDPLEAGRELGADAVVEGTLQKDGERLRVSVRLLPRGHDLLPWAERFDSPFTNLFAVEDALAERVALALMPRLDAAGITPLPPASRRMPRLDAHEAYLRGRLFWSRFDAEGLQKAVACFQEAVAKDPDYAQPHAGLADAFLVVALSGRMAPEALWPEARRAAEEALKRDADLAEARSTLGFIRLFQDWDWAGARQELARAASTSPKSAAVRQWRGLFLAMCGEYEPAQGELAVAREADPLSPVASAIAGLVHALRGDYEQELALARRAAELEPTRFLSHWSLAIACAHGGHFEQALAAQRRAVELAEGVSIMKPVLAWTLALAGQDAEARRLLAEIDAGGEYSSPYQRATVLAALGEHDRAIEMLAGAADARDPWITWIRVDPMLAPLRADRRFAALVARVCP